MGKLVTKVGKLYIIHLPSKTKTWLLRLTVAFIAGEADGYYFQAYFIQGVLLASYNQ